jgi:hypothetical protein
MKDAAVKFHDEPQFQPYGSGVILEDWYRRRLGGFSACFIPLGGYPCE